ncbi:MAG TPA: class I SAM-dependent methyltransferase [Solirubrobacteraceae bacterium]|nr:class I SAM-dependent methyltransferase [Solirubrobacteraceae bacterium]
MDRADPATWDRLARRYDAQERLELRAIDTAIRLAAPAADERLVDLGTGTGLLLRRLAAQPQRPRAAIGIDRSGGMLARAAPLAPGCSVLQADARAVPLPDGWADVVTCAYLLHLLGRQERHDVLSAARRLLRDTAAARLVVVTIWVDERRPPGRLSGYALRLAAHVRPRKWGGLRPLDPCEDLAAAGFEVTRRVVLTRGGYPSLVVAATPPLRRS